jgi:hypothetical protein
MQISAWDRLPSGASVNDDGKSLTHYVGVGKAALPVGGAIGTGGYGWKVWQFGGGKAGDNICAG